MNDLAQYHQEAQRVLLCRTMIYITIVRLIESDEVVTETHWEESDALVPQYCC